MAKSAKKENGNGKVQAEFRYEKDTKRTHRFAIGEYGEDISGTFYIPKGKPIPNKIILVKQDD